MTAITLTLPLLIIHLVTCASVYIAYRYKEAGDFHVIHHGLIPLVAGLLVLIPIWGAVYYNQAYPMNYAPYIVAVWFVIGLFVHAYLRRTKPEALKALESEMEMLSHPAQND